MGSSPYVCFTTSGFHWSLGLSPSQRLTSSLVYFCTFVVLCIFLRVLVSLDAVVEKKMSRKWKIGENSSIIPPFPSVTTSDLLPCLIKKWVKDPSAPGNSGPNPLNCLAVQSSLPLTSPGNSMAKPTPTALPYLRWSLQWLMREGGGDPAVDPSPRSILYLQPAGASDWREALLFWGLVFSFFFFCCCFLLHQSNRPVAGVHGIIWIKVVLNVPQFS